MIKGLVISIFAFIVVSLVPQRVLAQTCIPRGGRGTIGIDTAIGCIPIGNTTNLIIFVLKWGIGIGGGIAFLLILYSGFMIMTSSGNPERVKAGQELLTAAISGLLLLVFSTFILRIIGFDILKIIEP